MVLNFFKKSFQSFKSENLKTFLIFVFGFTLIFFSILFLYLFKLEPFFSLSQRFKDIYFYFNNRNVNPSVVLVVVDERSVNHFGRWPWDRKILAKGFYNLREAKVILLDMVFSEKTNPASDTALAKTIEELGNVVCGFFVRLNATQKIPEDIIDIMSDSALLRVPEKLPFETAKFIEPNILPITEACFLVGTFNAIPDKDNIFRHYPIGFVFQGDFYPSLGLQGLRVYLNQDVIITQNGKVFIGRKEIPIDDTHMALLNFYKYKKYSPYIIPFVDVYYGKIEPEFFKNKIVIVGISEAGVTDIRATPIGQIPGPLLHFTFISNVLNGELLKNSKILNITCILVFSLLVMVLFFFDSPLIRGLGYGAAISISMLSGIFLYIYFCYSVNIFFVVLNIIFLALFYEGYSAFSKGKQARFLKSAFGSYISDKLLEVIINNPEKLKLGGEKREVTVLFSDIRGFTSMSEKLEPEKLVEILNLYLTPMTELVLKNDGTLDKYIGDAIMALWNAPLDVDEHPKKALLTAYEMLKELENINNLFKNKYGFTIDIGIGINTGWVIVGNMGSQRRFDYTAIGDTVNLASRLEGLNKVYKTNVLFSEFTRNKISFEDLPFLDVEVDWVKVKGKEQAIKIYTLIEKGKDSFEIKEIYEKALEFYRKGNFKEAERLFKKILEKFKPAEVMHGRCQELIESPPEKWEGIYVAKTK